MDLVDILKEKRFLGQEFLTWLWWKSEERGGSLMLADFGEITLSFEKHMLLESGDGDAIEKLVCSGLQSELQEATEQSRRQQADHEKLARLEAEIKRLK